MEKLLFIVLAFFLMASGVYGGSTSMSCSMVNGKMICDRIDSPGGAAMAMSSAHSGHRGGLQRTYVGAGDPDGMYHSTGQKVVHLPGGLGFAGAGAGAGAGASHIFPGGFDPFAFVFGKRH